MYKSNEKKTRICIISEGCYPYVSGGVSSWIQMLLENMEEFEFLICSVVADNEFIGKYKYKFPGNVLKMYNITLDYMENYKGTVEKFPEFNNKMYRTVKGILAGEGFKFKDFYDTFGNFSAGQITGFLLSYEYYNIVKEINRNYFPEVPLNGFFWNTRAMLLPLFSLIVQDIPEADLYHSAATGYSGILACIGKYRYNKNYLLTEHGIYLREREEDIIKADWIDNIYKESWQKYFSSLCMCSYNESDRVVSLFTRNKDIQVELGCDSKKILLIPNGIRKEELVKENFKNQNSDEYINIGAILRVVPIKDVKTMIESFALVKDKIPKTRLYIMGPTNEEPEYYNECQELVERMEITDVIFTGLVKIKNYINQMDILVLSSISEGQPLAIIEGMACGKPHVATNVGCIEELLYGSEDDNLGEAGIVVPIMDHASMAEAIIELCKDKQLREKMGEVAKARYKNKYTIDNFINKYKKLYKCEVRC